MNVLDLFSGIGGFSLGLERAGMRTVAFCEIDPYARAVLRKHWPDVPCYEDVRAVTAARLRADGIHVDVICGGFPCQDISTAGKGAGLAGERSGLWSEIARLVGELRPRYVIVENVAALLSRGLERVLGDLAEIGYDAEWHCIPASYVGAPHRRDRIWIVAYPAISVRRQDAGGVGDCESEKEREAPGRRVRAGNRSARDDGSSTRGEDVADADQPRLEGWLGRSLQERTGERVAWESGPSMADASCHGLDWREKQDQPPNEGREQHSQLGYDADRRTDRGRGSVTGAESQWGESRGWWRVEPDVGRVAHGVPRRVDRLRCLGNAVVPQIPEIIGRAIMAATDSGTEVAR